MLIRLAVENFRSIRAPVELSLVAEGGDRSAAVRPAFPRPVLGVSLVPVAGIFGPNGAGKTNLLTAFAWLRRFLEAQPRAASGVVPLDRFAGSEAPAGNTSFDLEMEIDEVRYEYQLDVSPGGVTYEGLFRYAHGQRLTLCERERGATSFRVSGENLPTLVDATPATLSMLAILGQTEGTHAARFLRALGASVIIGVPEHRNRGAGAEGDRSTMSISSVAARSTNLAARRLRDRVLALLTLAEPEVRAVTIDPAGGSVVPHLVREQGGRSFARRLTDESAGTRAWFEIIGPALWALDTGSLLVVDELDAHLHPMLSEYLVDLFSLTRANPKGAQLLFSAQSSHLLNSLDRDQIWFAEKPGDGATRLMSLAEFSGPHARPPADFESGYLSGRFGAIPELSGVVSLRAARLIG